ncbi:thiamine diphosphokinase [Paenibacillus bouchesdurhonensis]|uniref:thiamine diphosphokinase n=1 Tax=Paenibacillus bouchesdurhonensis TaxID=1870990 RepID=UPI000DA5F9E7|nr:thiamine diphosphokinase [Paenibacillus bouchesdurhonensis]
MTEKRVLIFAGGNMSPVYLEEIRQDDLIIGADRGALFLVEHGIHPHISVGDFDSITQNELDKVKSVSGEIITCDPVNKDLTDTELAYVIAMDHQATEIVMMGVTGTRLDHTLANIQIMLRGLQHQIQSAIYDTHNYITLTGSDSIIQERGFTYVSLVPLTPEVTGICLTGFKYPLENATLRMGQSLGISNQLAEQEGTIRIESGLLLIIQSRD